MKRTQKIEIKMIDFDTFLRFLDAGNNPDTSRADKIHEEMSALRKIISGNEEWIRACLEQIPKTGAEMLYVSFTCGSTAGMEVAERIAEQN